MSTTAEQFGERIASLEKKAEELREFRSRNNGFPAVKVAINKAMEEVCAEMEAARGALAKAMKDERMEELRNIWPGPDASSGS